MPIPYPGRKLRGLATLCGILIFLWLAPENSSLLPVMALSIYAAVVLMSLWIARRLGGKTIAVWWLPLFGALVGLGANLLALLLMLVKNAQHAHTFPDFPPGMLVGVIERAPVWIIAGALFGLGLMLRELSHR